MDADEVSAQEFAQLVDAAVAALPRWVRDAVEGVAILTDDTPAAHEQPPRGTLYGRFHGIPATRTGTRVPGSLPSTIVLYRVPIVGDARDREHLRERIAAVLRHEIGHALGMGERRLRDLGVH